MQSLIKAFGGIGVFLLGMIVMTEALRWLTRVSRHVSRICYACPGRRKPVTARYCRPGTWLVSYRNRLEIDQAVVPSTRVDIRQVRGA